MNVTDYDDMYDAVVVGGGISGLIGAATLAADNFRVLLIEQNTTPGGCCATFSRNTFHFDTGTSSLSGLSPQGRFRKILDTIGIKQEFLRPGIRETIISPHFTLAIPADKEALKATLIQQFPEEKEPLLSFFNIIDGTRGHTAKRNTDTFLNTIREFSFSNELIFLFEALLGNLGLPADQVDANTGIAFFREYVFDGGYYPVGGMRSLANSLLRLVRANGGKTILGHKVDLFSGDSQRIRAVRLDDGREFMAATFIAAMDASKVITEMTPPPVRYTVLKDRLSLRSPSPSAFMVFLGIDCPIKQLTKHQGHLLCLPEGSMAEIYRSLSSDELLFATEGYVYIIAPSRVDPGMAPEGCESLCLFVMAPYRDAEFWQRHRQQMIETLLARAEKNLPGLSKHIKVIDSATPLTIARYTGGLGGATYGWQALPEQSGISRLSPVTAWENLFLAGHWTRPGSGISSAAYSGFLAAKMVKRQIYSKNKQTT